VAHKGNKNAKQDCLRLKESKEMQRRARGGGQGKEGSPTSKTRRGKRSAKEASPRYRSKKAPEEKEETCTSGQKENIGGWGTV